MKLCVECTHFSMPLVREGESKFYRAECHALSGQPNPINGSPMSYINADAMRTGGPCGWDGKMWKAKE